mgnify:CR=1 FL=1|tara:strand:+ start:638 stop:913 length:276 start_codon:yes stop_codon:yes gene_type:complete
MREPYINNLIDNNINDIFIQLQYNKIVNDNEVVYKKHEYSYQEFKIKKISNNKYLCSVPIKGGVQYQTNFNSLNDANHYILSHLDHFHKTV